MDDKKVMFERSCNTITVYNADRNDINIKWLLNCYSHLLSVPFKKYTCDDFIAEIKKVYDSPQAEQAEKYLFLEDIKNKPVLKGKEWNKYLEIVKIKEIPYMKVYHSTYNYNQIYKVGEYHFYFAFTRGYKNLSALRRLISTHL